jgi:hypothetical protein
MQMNLLRSQAVPTAEEGPDIVSREHGPVGSVILKIMVYLPGFFADFSSASN